MEIDRAGGGVLLLFVATVVVKPIFNFLDV